MQYNTKNIFLKNYTQNVVEKLFPDPFLKIRNWAYLWINSLKCCRACFYCMSSWGLSKYIETKQKNTCFYLSFFKKQRGLELVSLPHLVHDFWRKKIFLWLYSINWSDFIVWLLLLCEMLDNMCILIVC